MTHVNTDDAKIWQRHPFTDKGRKVLLIVLMLLLLVALFGLLAGLVFFSEGVIEPKTTL